MNKKMWLTTGTVSSVFVPLATVVACSTKDYSYNDKDKKILADLEKSSTKQKLENKWMGLVLKEVYGKFDLNVFANNSADFQNDFKSSIIYSITENLRKNPSFLVQVLSKIAQNDKGIDPTNMDKTGSVANQTARGLKWDLAINTIPNVNKAIADIKNNVIAKVFYDLELKSGKTVFNPDSIGLKHDILKSLITRSFLKLTKTKYMETFGSEYINDPKSAKELTLPVTENYPLIKNAIKAKVGFQWKISLDTANTAQFMNPGDEKKVFKDITKHMVKGFQKNLKLSEINSIIPTGISNVDETMQGFQGIKPIAGGVGTLSTLPAHMKKQTKPRIGWLFDSQVVTEFKEDGKTKNGKKVTIIKDNKLSLTKVQMILPEYTNGQLEFKAARDKTDISVETAINALITNDPNMYDEALKYYTTRLDSSNKDTSIKLEVHNKKIRDILVEKGYDFIKTDK